jgi:hypothetical protein
MAALTLTGCLNTSMQITALIATAFTQMAELLTEKISLYTATGRVLAGWLIGISITLPLSQKQLLTISDSQTG